MTNGNKILKREIAGDIKAIEDTTVPRGVGGWGRIVKFALIRSLRIGEQAYNASSRNTALLVILILLVLKNDAIALGLKLLKMWGMP